MRKLTSLLFTLLLGAGLYAQNTVVDIIVNSPDHDTLESAVIAAGLDDDLAGDGPFTVFAPTDAAFAALPAGLLDSLLLPDNADSLAIILSYHVVVDSLTSDSIVVDSMAFDEDGLMIATLQGDSIMITVDTMGGDTVLMVNETAMITMADIIADNGVVHVIDAVLLPPADTMGTSLRREPAFAAGVILTPNPAATELQVQLPDAIAGRALLTLRDFNGRTLQRRAGAGLRERLDVSALPTGTYLLEIRAGREAIQRRVVVQR